MFKNKKQLPISIAISMVLLSACTSFQEKFPIQTGTLSFLDDRRSSPVLSAAMRARQRKLSATENKRIQQNFSVLIELLESSKSFRVQLKRRRDLVKNLFDDEGKVNAVDAELVLEAAHWYLELDALLYQIWLTWRDYLPHSSEPDAYAPYRGARLFSDEVRAKGGLLAVVAEILRMENTAYVMGVLDDSWALTQWLNTGDAARGIEPETYDRIVGSLYDPEHRFLLQKQLKNIVDKQEKLQNMAAQDGEVGLLLAYLQNNTLVESLMKEGGFKRQWRFAAEISRRGMASLFSPVVEAYIASVYDSRLVEETETIIKLADTPQIADSLMDHLVPLDVLYLRDLRREGAGLGYTHALIYLGRPDQLRASILRDHIFVKNNIQQMRQGKIFLGLVGTGPILVRLEDVLEAHDVLLVRYETAVDAYQTSAMKRLLDAVFLPQFVAPPRRKGEAHSAALLEQAFGASALGLSSEDFKIEGGLRPLIANMLREPEERVLPTETSVASSEKAMKQGILLFATTNAQIVRSRNLRKDVRVYMEARTPLTVTHR